MQEYESKVPEKIIDSPASVLIDQASLRAFIKNSTLVHELDKRIAANAKAEILGEMNNFSELRYVGLETIADIESALREFGDIAVELANKWLKDEEFLMGHFFILFMLYISCT